MVYEIFEVEFYYFVKISCPRTRMVGGGVEGRAVEEGLTREACREQPTSKFTMLKINVREYKGIKYMPYAYNYEGYN